MSTSPTRPGSWPVIDGAFRALEWIIGLCLAIMVVLVFGNVVMRYVFNSGIAVSEELARLGFVWLIFLGAIVALRERSHIGIDMLVTRLPPIGKRACLLINTLLQLYVLWLFFDGSWQQTVIGMQSALPVTGLPEAVINGAGVVVSAAMGAILLVDFVRLLFGGMSDQELVQVAGEGDEVATIHRELAADQPPHQTRM